MSWTSEYETPDRFRLNRRRFALLCARIRVTMALWLPSIPEGMSAVRHFAAERFSTPRRGIITAAFIIAVVVPSLLFLRERSLRIQQQSQLRYIASTVISENGALKNTLQDMLAERVQLRSLLLDAGYQVETPRELHVKVMATGYTSSPHETDDTPFITAANTMTRPGIIALSRDLLRPYTPGAPFTFGDKVWLDGLGEFIIEDSMNHRWRRSADIWFSSRQQAVHFGRRELYLSRISDNVDPSGLNLLAGVNN